MTHRTLPRQRLSRSPLVQVLAQAVFSSPVLAMPRYLPEIHDVLRRQLDLSETDETTETEIVFSLAGEPQTKQERKRWTFYRPDRRWAVVLSEQLVVLHTSAYDTFEDFAWIWRQVIEVVFGTVGIPRLQRIGLRYTDRVVLGPDEQAEQYLSAALLGYPRDREAALGARRVFARSDTVLQTAAGLLSLRCVEGQGLVLPPDLLPSVLVYPDAPSSDARVLLLDLDHSRAGEASAQPSTLADDFWALHDSLDLAFRNVVTDQALRAWGQEVFT